MKIETLYTKLKPKNKRVFLSTRLVAQAEIRQTDGRTDRKKNGRTGTQKDGKGTNQYDIPLWGPLNK